jgi:hypothetical protein
MATKPDAARGKKTRKGKIKEIIRNIPKGAASSVGTGIKTKGLRDMLKKAKSMSPGELKARTGSTMRKRTTIDDLKKMKPPRPRPSRPGPLRPRVGKPMMRGGKPKR